MLRDPKHPTTPGSITDDVSKAESRFFPLPLLLCLCLCLNPSTCKCKGQGLRSFPYEMRRHSVSGTSLGFGYVIIHRRQLAAPSPERRNANKSQRRRAPESNHLEDAVCKCVRVHCDVFGSFFAIVCKKSQTSSKEKRSTTPPSAVG